MSTAHQHQSLLTRKLQVNCSGIDSLLKLEGFEGYCLHQRTVD